jgi:hypothetical protein
MENLFPNPKTMKSPDTITKRWGGLPMTEHPSPTLDAAIESLPRFTTAPISRFGFKDNLHRVFVINDPAATTPVAMVSNTYQIVQHAEMLTAAMEFLTAMECPVAGPVKVQLSPHGERMAAWLELGDRFVFNPDGHPVSLHLLCANTVDGGGSMQASLIWIRKICSNGMTVRRTCRSALRHGIFAEPNRVFDPLAMQLRESDALRQSFETWHSQPIDLVRVRAWADTAICDAWGKQAAARLWSIATTGMDAAFAPPFTTLPASRRKVKTTIAVPGAPTPSRTLYDVAQAASWIATHRTDFEQGQLMQQQIAPLITLLN